MRMILAIRSQIGSPSPVPMESIAARSPGSVVSIPMVAEVCGAPAERKEEGELSAPAGVVRWSRGAARAVWEKKARRRTLLLSERKRESWFLGCDVVLGCVQQTSCLVTSSDPAYFVAALRLALQGA